MLSLSKHIKSAGVGITCRIRVKGNKPADTIQLWIQTDRQVSLVLPAVRVGAYLDSLSGAGDEGFPLRQLGCVQVKLLWIGLNDAFTDR